MKATITLLIGAAFGVSLCVTVAALTATVMPQVAKSITVIGIATYAGSLILFALTWLGRDIESVFKTNNTKSAFKAGLLAPYKAILYLLNIAG